MALPVPDRASGLHRNPKDRPKRSTRTVPPALILLLLIAAGVAVYSASLGAPFVFDDFENIEYMSTVRMDSLSVENLIIAARGRIPSRPVANLSFALNFYLHGYSVFGYHLVNLLIHSVNGVLLFLLLRRTFALAPVSGVGGPATGLGPAQREAAAALSALVWVVHPIQTQAVTYVVQRMTSMAAMFYLAALLCYVAGRQRRQGRQKILFFCACAISGGLALGSKEIAATLPVALFFYEWFFFQDLDRKWFWKKAGILLLALVLVLLAGMAYTGRNPLELMSHLLAGYKNRPFTLTERLMTQPRVVVFYLSLLVFPHPSRLNMFHDLPVSHSLTDPATTVPAMLLIAGLLALAVARARKNRFAAFAVFWFFGNLVIESSIVPLEMVFEHRSYLPSMLLLAAAVASVIRWMKPFWRPALAVLICAAVLGTWTYQRNTVWADEVRLLTDCVEKSPDQARTHYGLAGALAERGRLTDAAAHLERAIALDPGHREAQNALGALMARMGRTEAAIAAFEKVLRLDPDYAGAHYNLGRVYHSMGESAAAVVHFEKVLEQKPYMSEALLQLTWLRATAPDHEVRDGKEALAMARRLIRLVGQNQPLALDALAAAYAENGQYETAANTANRAGELAERYQLPRLAEQISQREALYRAGRPFREGGAP